MHMLLNWISAAAHQCVLPVMIYIEVCEQHQAVKSDGSIVALLS